MIPVEILTENLLSVGGCQFCENYIVKNGKIETKYKKLYKIKKMQICPDCLRHIVVEIYQLEGDNNG